ncbi:MAG: DUF2017 domain-containing protein, partial [Actinomycetales bacterium]
TQEAQVLINLLEQLLELLGEPTIAEPDPLFNLLGITGNELPPEDPVLRRLLPNAYEDENAASEFRRYTEQSLREKKRASAHLIYEALIPSEEEWSADQPLDKATIEVKLKLEEVGSWLSSLNDLRLALAVRLGIGDEDSSDKKSEGAKEKFEVMVESDPMKAVYAVYSWLGWLQQSLLEAIE